MSLAETSFTYENKAWECALLPYRIIVCKDHIQYIVQLQRADKCRNLSYPYELVRHCQTIPSTCYGWPA